MNKNIAITLFVSLLGTNLCTLAMNETFAVCALKEKPFWWWTDKKPRVIQLPPEAEIKAELIKLSGSMGSAHYFANEFAATVQMAKEGRGFYSHMRLDSPLAITGFVTGFIEGQILELGQLIGIVVGMGDGRFKEIMGVYKEAKQMKEVQPEIIKILLKNHPEEIKKLSEDLKWRPLPDINELMKY